MQSSAVQCSATCPWSVWARLNGAESRMVKVGTCFPIVQCLLVCSPDGAWCGCDSDSITDRERRSR